MSNKDNALIIAEVKKVFPEYSGFEAIGEGANGLVFKVHKEHSSFALKILKNAKNIEHFRKEIAYLACLKSPYVVDVIEGGVREGLSYVVSEFIGGKTLDLVLSEEKKFEEETFKKLFTQMSLGLLDIHNAGFTHRDIKPSNIMVSGDQIKIIDFGLISRSLEQNNEMIGSIGYASPEQMQLIKTSIDHRSDLYSLGCIAYECLSGEPWLKGSSAQEILNIQLKKKINTADLPVSFSKIVEKLIQINVEDRFDDTKQVLMELGLTPPVEGLVGRESELLEINKGWKKVQLNKSQVLIVQGESGFGKSRLIQSFMDSLDGANIFLFKEKYEENEINPLGALSRAWDRYIRHVQSLTLEEKNRAINNMLVCAGNTPAILNKLSPRIHSLKIENLKDIETDFSEDQFAAVAANFFVQFFKSQSKPVVFILDDIQWMPMLSQKIVNNIIQDMKSNLIYFIFSARSESQQTPQVISFLEKDNKEILKLITIGPLLPEAIEDLIHKKLGQREVAAEIIEKVIELSSGSPFLIIQYIFSLLEGGGIYVHDGAWRIDEEQLHRSPLPKNITELMLSRLNSLEMPAKKILAIAALLGSQFSKKLVLNILAISDEQFLYRFNQLLRAGMVEDKDKHVANFSHDKVFELFLSMSSDEEKKSIHAKVVELLSAHEDENIYDLAYHAARAEGFVDMGQAVRLNLNAGIKAFKSNLDQQAFYFFKYAESNQNTFFNQEELFTIYYSLGKICFHLSLTDEGLNYIHKAISLAKSFEEILLSRMEEIKVAMHVAWDYEHAGHLLDETYQALNIPRTESFWLTFVKAIGYIFLSFFFYFYKAKKVARFQHLSYLDRLTLLQLYSTGNLPNPVIYFPRYIYYSLRMGPCAETLYSYSMIMLALGVLNKPKYFKKLARVIYGIANSLQDPFLLARVKTDEAMTYFISGDHVQADKMIRNILRYDTKWVLPDDHFRLVNNFSYSLWMMGQTDETQTLLESALKNLPSIGSRVVLYHALLSCCYSAHGMETQAHENEKTLQALISKYNDIESEPRKRDLFYFCRLTKFDFDEKYDSEADQFLQQVQRFSDRPKRPHITQKIWFFALIIYLYNRAQRTQSENDKLKFIKTLDEIFFSNFTKYEDIIIKIMTAAKYRFLQQPHKHRQVIRDLESKINQSESDLANYLFYLESARFSAWIKESNGLRMNLLQLQELVLRRGWVRQQQQLSVEFVFDSIGLNNDFQNRVPLSATSTSTLSKGSNSKLMDSLLKVSLAAASSFDSESQVMLTLDEMINVLNAERGFVFTYDQNKNAFTPIMARNDKMSHLENLHDYSKTVMNNVLKEKKPYILLMDDKGELLQSESIIARGLKSVMAVPMFLKDQLYGAVYFDSQLVKGLFSQEDFQICQSLSNHIVFGFEMAKTANQLSQMKAFEKDLELTASVQSLLFPKMDDLRLHNLHLSGVYKPSTHCSGDWWWYTQMNNEVIRLFAIDVTGHGAASAMITSVIATYVRFFSSDSSIQDFLQQLSEKLYALVKGNYCSTATVLEINTLTGEFDFISAASPPVMILSQDGAVEVLEIPGSLLGQGVDDPQFSKHSGKLSPGDRLILVSDGMIEVPTKAEINFNFRKLVKILKSVRTGDLAHDKAEIMFKVNEFVGDVSKLDDMTLILLDFQNLQAA